MRELTSIEIDAVDGAGPLAGASLGLGAASVIGGGLACVPTPASPALAAFAVVTGILSIGLAWADSKIETSEK